MCVYTTPLPWTGCDTKSSLKRSPAAFNTQFSFSFTSFQTILKNTIKHYLPIVGGRTDGFMPFTMTLAQRELQPSPSRFWTLERFVRESLWRIVGWLFVLVLCHINLCRLFNAKSIFMQIVLFQTIQFSLNTQFNCQKHFYFKLFSLLKQFYFS